MTGRRAPAVALLVAIMVAGSCTEEDGDESPTWTRPDRAVQRTTPARTSPAPTRSRFVREANALCTKAKRRAAPIAEAVNAEVAQQDAAGAARELRKALPVAEELRERLDALTPPAGDEAVVARYLRFVAGQAGRIRSLADALEGEDISTIEILLEELREANRRGRRLAGENGLAQCRPTGLPTTG